MCPLFKSSYFPRQRIKSRFLIQIHEALRDLNSCRDLCPHSDRSGPGALCSTHTGLSLAAPWCSNVLRAFSPAAPLSWNDIAQMVTCLAPPHFLHHVIIICHYIMYLFTHLLFNWDVSSRRAAALLLLLLFIIVYIPHPPPPGGFGKRGWDWEGGAE